MHFHWQVKGKLRRLQYFLQYLHFIIFPERSSVQKLSFCQFFLEHRKYPWSRVISNTVKVIFNQCKTKEGEDTESCRSRHLSQRELNLPQKRGLSCFFFNGALYLIHWLKRILSIRVVLHELPPAIRGISVSSLQSGRDQTRNCSWKWSRTCYGIASEGGRFSVRLA